MSDWDIDNELGNVDFGGESEDSLEENIFGDDKVSEVDIFGDADDTESPEEPAVVEEVVAEEAPVVDTSLKSNDKSKAFSWGDMADFSNFRATYDSLTESQLEVVHALLKNSRTSDSALIVAKKLLEDGIENLDSLVIIKDLADSVSDGGISIGVMVKFTSAVAQSSGDTRHGLVKISNSVFGGEPIKWRKNLSVDDIATKIIEKSTSEGSDSQILEFLDDLFKVWPGKRSA